jgi:hypothetical protein
VTAPIHRQGGSGAANTYAVTALLHDTLSIAWRHNPRGSSPTKFGSYPLRKRHSERAGPRSIRVIH